ncbi:MAG: hypothetical protein Q9218_008257 [Villophora microphyllina]
MANTLRLHWPYDLPTLKTLHPIPDTSNAATLENDAEPTIAHSTPAAYFPWDKLPTEIRLEILQLTMPEHGLRPIPHAAGDLDTSDSHASDSDASDPACGKYIKRLREVDAMPKNLF